MNCVNCGAPPKRGSRDCLFCGTPLAKIAAKIDKIGFESALKAMQACAFDIGRSTIGDALAKRKTPFTAGQVRMLARTFAFDVGRVRLFSGLMPYITNPLGVLECGDVMAFDTSRMALARLVGDCEPSGDPQEEEEEEAPTPTRAATPVAADPFLPLKLILMISILIALIALVIR